MTPLIVYGNPTPGIKPALVDLSAGGVLSVDTSAVGIYYVSLKVSNPYTTVT